MQRSQKEQQTFVALRQLLQDLEVGEEQFKEALASIVPLACSEEGSEQLPETASFPIDQRTPFAPLLVNSSHVHSDRQPLFQMASSAAFRTELLARFCLVMFDQADPEKYL